MTVRITKDKINIREKLSELDKPSGIVGEQLLRSDTAEDAREALNLEEHLFEDFESTGIDDNATSTKVTVSDSGVDVDGNLSFGDSDKATFGASDDLEIYHDGSHSYIKDTGSGILYVQGSGQVRIGGSDGTTGVEVNEGGDVKLRYSNANKLATTSTGVDVTGTITADGLIVAGNVGIGTDSPNEKLHINGNIKVAANSVAEGLGYHAVMSSEYGDDALKLLSCGKKVLEMGGYNNALTMKLYTNDTERMRITSSGNVGIGTTSPISLGGHSGVLTLYGSNATALVLQDSTSRKDLRLDNGDLSFRNSSGDTHLIVKDDGKVGILKSDPKGQLHVDGVEYSYFSSNVAGVTPNSVAQGIALGWNKSSGGGESVIAHNKGPGSFGGLVFANNNNGVYREDARIDSSGALLVGKTSTTIAENGHVLFANGQSNHTATNGEVTRFVRKGSNGFISIFYKDGLQVGSISTAYETLHIGQNETRLIFDAGGTPSIKPSTSAGENRDGAVDLGESNARFKDLYLSGGVFLGGTDATNKLDDYEEGTWTPSVTGVSSTGTSNYTVRVATYTKVGNLCYAQAYIVYNSFTGTGEMRVTGLPFLGDEGSYKTHCGSLILDNILLPTSTVNLTARAQDGQSFLRLVSTRDNTTAAAVQCDAAGVIQVGFSYRTS